jgi:hypothetical protein
MVCAAEEAKGMISRCVRIIRSKARTTANAALSLDFRRMPVGGMTQTHRHCLPHRQTLPVALVWKKPPYPWKNAPNKVARPLRHASAEQSIRNVP